MTATMKALAKTKPGVGLELIEAPIPVAGDEDVLIEALQGVDMQVSGVEEKPYTRRPYAPFMTSTLQQEAGLPLADYDGQTVTRFDPGWFIRRQVAHIPEDRNRMLEWNEYGVISYAQPLPLVGANAKVKGGRE